LQNAGTREGDEVAQIYFRHVNSAVPQPKLALCGFARMHVDPGQGARVTMDIPVQRFRYWEASHKNYGLEVGDYELLIGASSDDIRQRVPFKFAAQ
jgi:beta-glucosidase